MNRNYFYLFLMLIWVVPASAKETLVALKDLHERGYDGFNLEGGKPGKSLPRDKTWVNLCIVLDRPLIDGETLKGLTDKNPFALKENSIAAYNVAQANFSYLLVSRYYIDNAHKISKKKKGEPVIITIQVHRNSSALPQINLIRSMLVSSYGAGHIAQDTSSTDKIAHTFYFKKKNVFLQFKRGYQNNDLSADKNTDILISFSLMGGVNAQLPSGSVVMPAKFSPTHIKGAVIHETQKYRGRNNLVVSKTEILSSQRKEDLEMVNEKFLSENPKKKDQKARFFTQEDWPVATLLEIDQLWNPKNLNAKFIVHF